jgi:pimeloyl-ACP methyl ester carboxylesterase
MVTNHLERIGVGYAVGSLEFSKDRPTLVMIHGAGGCARLWQCQIDDLNESMNTLALDLPGHGNSRGQPKVDIQSYAHWIGETLPALFDVPVYLMGHSMGGAIVQETAIHYPKILKGIILVATGFKLPVAPAFLQGLQDDFEKTVDTIMHYAYAPGTGQWMVDEGSALLKASGSKLVFHDFLACNEFDRQKELSDIDLPCLVVCGDQDKMTPPSLSRRLQQLIRGSRMKLLAEAGHMVMIEKPTAFNQCIREFIPRNRS